MIADIQQSEVKYVFDALPSPREAPIFMCTCTYKSYCVVTQGIGKKNPKQEAARLLLLILSGDVETNPGPVQSRPIRIRYNDPRSVQLEKVIERKEQKIKTLIKELRRAIKTDKIYSQGIFDTIKDGNKTIKESATELNGNLDRVCNFLESMLPSLQANIQATIINTTDKLTEIKEDLIKITLICLIIRLLMVWKHYKTALTVVLIFVVKFYKMDEYIITLAKELQDKMMRTEAQGFVEDAIYHPYFQTCGKIIFAAVSFICIRKIPGKQDWDNYIMRLDRIPKALEGSRKIVDYCSEYFNLATDQVKMLVLGKTSEELQRANGLYSEIHDWAKEVRTYLDLEQRNKIDTDITIANKVEDLYKRGVKYQADTLLDREMTRLVATTLLPARELYQYVSCSPVKGGGPRMRPICLWLVGESGVGKTEMVYPLCIDVLRAMGLMKKTDFHHQVYGRQVETEFWDGYKGQKIVIYDDAFQMKDDKTSPNPEIFEVIRSCNTFPQHLHMAAIHDKNTFSQAELMLYTTNDANVKLESITFPDAFFNRIGEHAYKVMPKMQYAKMAEKRRSGKMYRKLDTSKLDPTKPIDLSIYEFQKIVRDDSNTCQGWTDKGEPMDYEQFQQMICNEWRIKKQTSIDKLKYLENYAIRAQVGEDVFYDANDFQWFVDDISSRICKGEDLITIENDYAQDEKKFTSYMDFKKSKPPTIWDKYRNRLDAMLLIVSDKMKIWKERIIKILSEHPYLSLLGFVGMALSTFAIYKWFENSVIDCDAEVGTSGDVKTAKQNYRIVEVGTSGDAKTSKTPKVNVECEMSIEDRRMMIEAVNGNTIGGACLVALMKKYKWGIYSSKYDEAVTSEVGVSSDAKTNRQSMKRVEMMDEQLQDLIQTQGCSDEAAHNLITDVLQKNTYRMTYQRGDKRIPFGNCTFIRGWAFLMPYHFLHALYARKLAPEAIISLSQSKYQDIIQFPISHLIDIHENGFNLTNNCEQLLHKNGEKRDCILVNLHKRMCHSHRDLINHFVKIEDQGKLQGKFCGTYATFHESNKELYRSYQWLMQIKPVDKSITIHLPEDGYDYLEKSYTQRECYEYNAPTQVGDCGSIVGLYNHRMERKLIGIHIAGTKDQFGFACPLTQEAIKEACDSLIKKDIANVSTQFYYEVPKIVDPTREIKVPEGLFCPLGKAKAQIGQANKTSIQPSSIYGELSVPFMTPAILKPTMINGQMHDPLLMGLKKCGVETAVLHDEEVLSASQDTAQVVLTQYNSMLDRSKYQRILTYEEAIRGTLDDDFMCAINRTTSPGYPYCLDSKGFPGKTKWMGKGEEFDFTSDAALQLRKDVEELIEDCKNGKISNVFFVDTLKDERRELTKVKAGKTRVFSAGPQHFVVAFRKHFLPFAAWLMHNRIDNEVCVGTNPYSVDWERIAKKMKSKGKHVIAGDFGNFDGSLVAQILWSIFWEIFVPWLQQFNDFGTSEGQDILKTCLGLWTHLVHSVHIFQDNVYMWTHSQPSGNPFTVIINCLYNSIIMRIAWIRIMEKSCPKYKSMKWFRKFVAMINFGDDNELNISEEVIDIFNQETISEIMKEMKHEYTDEAKSGNIVKSRLLEDTFFLKRGFRFCPELQRTVAPLKIEVIYEMLNWTRNTVDPDVILMSNIETAFREIVYHGREEYDKLKKGMMKISNKLPAIPQILTYGQYLHDISYLADEVYSF